MKHLKIVLILIAATGILLASFYVQNHANRTAATETISK